jgi:CBS domain containing-hemolysin-like protein
VNWVLLVLFLAGNAFFVGGQFALITARRDQIEPLAREGRVTAAVTLTQMQALPRLLAGSQLGIAACSLGLGAVAEPAISGVLTGALDALGAPHELLHPLAFAIALGVVAFFHMVVGEMVPKNLALAGPVRAALLLGPPMAAWVRLTRPLLVVIGAAADGLLRVFRVQPRHELTPAYTPDELAHLIDESEAEGLLDRSEQLRLARVLALDLQTARDLAIPMSELVTLDPRCTATDLEQVVARTGYSRFPVRSTSGPDLLGYVHAKDLLTLDASDYDDPLPAPLVRPLVVIDAHQPLIETFATLQHAGQHMGRVVNEGQTIGTVTLEDVLEELVGEIRDASHHPDAE